jgi:hypothetical protein
LEIAPGIPGLLIQPATDLTPLLSNGDLFVIQAETAVPNGTTNTNISTFVNKVKPFAAEIHRINPNVRAIAEVSTTPGGSTTNLDILQRCWMAVADECDDVTVWPGNQPDKLLRDFVDKLLRDLQAHLRIYWILLAMDSAITSHEAFVKASLL